MTLSPDEPFAAGEDDAMDPCRPSTNPTALLHRASRSPKSSALPSQKTVGSTSTASAITEPRRPSRAEPRGAVHWTCQALGYTPMTTASARSALRAGRTLFGRPNGKNPQSVIGEQYLDVTSMPRDGGVRVS